MNASNKLLLSVAAILETYQRELTRLFKQSPNELRPEFTREFIDHYGQIAHAAPHEPHYQEIASVCHRMHEFLHSQRPSITGVKHRKVTTHKEARATRSPFSNSLAVSTLNNQTREHNRKEVREIMLSYELEPPVTRMRWRDAYSSPRQTTPHQPSQGSNTLQQLADTIPQIQESIRRLSLKKPAPTFWERQKERQNETSRSKRKPFPFLF